ncbi:MAG: YybH family protein [Chitinophagales bacterium]
MKFLSLTLIIIFFSMRSYSQNKDEQDIHKLMEKQTRDWNSGSIDEFMKGYWNSDSLMFIGREGIRFGYKAALNNYKRNYSDTAHMGRLFFTILKTDRISTDAYFVVGKWFLKRTMGDIGGVFTLLFRRINGKWLIVSDHTS